MSNRNRCPGPRPRPQPVRIRPIAASRSWAASIGLLAHLRPRSPGTGPPGPPGYPGGRPRQEVDPAAYRPEWRCLCLYYAARICGECIAGSNADRTGAECSMQIWPPSQLARACRSTPDHQERSAMLITGLLGRYRTGMQSTIRP